MVGESYQEVISPELLIQKREALVEKRRLMAESAAQLAPSKDRSEVDLALAWSGLGGGRALESIARNVGEPFNRGVISMLEFPITLSNAAVAGGYALAGEEDAPQMRYPISEMASSAGLTAPPEEQKHGVIARTAEFTGAGMIPQAAVMSYGSRLTAIELSGVPTVLQNMGAATASSPGVATAYDLAANFTAAAGGEVARQFTDNQTIIAMAELGSAFLPTAAVLAVTKGPTGRALSKAHEWALETLAPFTEKGAMVAASRRLQDVAADPKGTAAALDVDSPIPPMQQSDDPGILQLQERILKQDPKAHFEFSEELKEAVMQLSAEGTVKMGKFERATHILNLRQQMAVEEAAEAVRLIGVDATPRQISVAARNAVSKSLDDATILERELWDSVDSAAPADVEKAVEALAGIISKRSPDADPSEIPAWLLNKLSPNEVDDALMAELQKMGLVNDSGEIAPAILKQLEESGAFAGRPQRTLEDVKVLRSRVLQEMRDEQAAQGRGPNRRKIAILHEIQTALLEDLTATGVKGVDEARAFSAQLNARYRSGRIGRLMGFDATGAERVASEDFLQDVIYGPHNATNTKLLGEMASEAPELSLDFIRRKYIDSVVDPSGSINQRAHNSFIKNAKDKGLFEIFPELEAELTNISAKSLEAMKLQVPERKIGSQSLSPEQSRAALMLQALPGDEMAFVLRSKNPHGVIQDIMKTRAPDGTLLRTDLQAVRGLQDSFVEELFNQATTKVKNEMVVQGDNLAVLLTEHKLVMRELNMSDQHIKRLTDIAENIRLAQLTPSGEIDIGSGIMNTKLNSGIKLLSTLMGARAGARVGKGGASLLMASFMSKESRDRIMNLTKSEAEALLVRAVEDPQLYRSLLLGPRSSTAAQERAAAIIEREILKLESMGTTTLAVGAAQDNEDTQ